MTIRDLKDKLVLLNKKVGQVSGEFDYLSRDYQSAICKKEILEKDIDTFNKSVELLSRVQAVTRDRVKEQFEGLISWGLSYVFNEEYKFILEFTQRGNLQELSFLVKPPHLAEPVNILGSSGGGISNVVSLMLRLILMELSKINGYIIIDEGMANVNGKENIERLNGFLEEISKKFKRQVLHITNFDCFLNNESYNKILIGESNE